MLGAYLISSMLILSGPGLFTFFIRLVAFSISVAVKGGCIGDGGKFIGLLLDLSGARSF